MELVSNYIRNDEYRHMLNDLTRKTFGFDFESWVNNGYFEGDYIPYSFIDDGKIVSNVSANIMHFMQKGIEKNYIQIGTVMTDEKYRKQGLAAKLIEHVVNEYESKCDGIYLFGNLDATGFYEKMNFKILNQYRYFVKDEYLSCKKSNESLVSVNVLGDEIKKRYLEMIKTSACQSSFDQINKYGLQMFYTADFDTVYYAKDIDCFVVLDSDDGLVLEAIICNKKIALADIVTLINTDNQKLRLGFTPCDEDKNICCSEIYDGADDYRLFYKGEKLETIEKDKLYFPDLSHA